MRILGKIKTAAAILAVAVCTITGETTADAVAPINSEYESYSIANYVAMHNSELSYSEAKVISDGITYYSAMYGVDPLLMTALIQTESNFNQNSISSAGAIGIGQIMPDTAISLGVNPYDMMQNIQGACSYISTALKNFGSWPSPTEAALAAYNAGGNAVIKYGGIPPYSETQAYVAKIKNRYKLLQGMINNVTVVDEIRWSGDLTYSEGFNNDGYIEYVEQDIPKVQILDAADF